MQPHQLPEHVLGAIAKSMGWTAYTYANGSRYYGIDDSLSSTGVGIMGRAYLVQLLKQVRAA